MTLLEQGKVKRTDTTINLTNWAAAPTTNTVGTPVDRMMHNTNQIIRATLTQPNPDFTQVKILTAPSTYSYSTMSELIDGVKSNITASPSNIYAVTVGFTNTPNPIVTDKIYFYTKFPFNTTKGKIYTSFIEDELGFALATGTTTFTQTFDNIEDVYVYTVNFSTPQKFNYIRIMKHGTLITDYELITEKITEIEPRASLTPTLKYWFFGSSVETAGSEGVTKQFPENTLDIAYDSTHERFYAIRFQDGGGTSVPLDDDFTELASTTNFDNQRWEEDVSSVFNRDIEEDNLVYNASTGFGKLTSRFTIDTDFDVEIEFNEIDIHSSNSYAYLRVLDSNENIVASAGISDDTYNSLYVTNIKNLTDGASITQITPKQATAVSQTWVVTHRGSNSWTVSGTVSGAEDSNASTGVTFDGSENSFFIASTSPHAIGESFEFDVVNDSISRTQTSGTLSISRSVGSIQMSADDTGGTQGISNTTTAEAYAPVKMQVYAATSGTSSHVTFDNFVVNSGTGTYPGVPSFTVERLNAEGLSDGSDVISTLDIINDASKGYNDYLGGSVAIAHANSKIYLKVKDRLMRFADTASIVSSDGTTDGSTGHAEVTTTGEVPVRDITSFSVITMNVNPATGVDDGPKDFLVYQYTNPDTNQLEIRTVTTSGLVSDVSNRLLVVDNSEITSTNRNFFWNSNDLNTMYFIEDDGSIYQYNTDDRLAGFVNVNFEDPNLPAGTGEQSEVYVTIANVWGCPLAGKTVSFDVIVGDGTISPSSGETNAEGMVDSPSIPVFTSGSTVGTTTIRTTVNQ